MPPASAVAAPPGTPAVAEYYDRQAHWPPASLARRGIALTTAIAAIVFVWLLRVRKLGDIVPLALVLGGALGNILDRIKFGYVLDYADFHIGTFRPFLIFNLADAAITVGVVIILARSFLIREKTATEPAGTPATEN